MRSVYIYIYNIDSAIKLTVCLPVDLVYWKIFSKLCSISNKKKKNAFLRIPITASMRSRWNHL